MPDYFPAFLDLRGRRCLVVGGGPVGERKVHDLLACGAAVILVSPTLTAGLVGLVAKHRLRHLARRFRPRDARSCALVIAATGVAPIDALVAGEARRQHTLVNVVDRPRQCDFILPPVLRRGQLQIAVSTGGRGPALAREIRKSLEPHFPPDYGDFIERVGQKRRRARAQATSAAARMAAGEHVVQRALATRRAIAPTLAGPPAAGHPRLPSPLPPPAQHPPPPGHRRPRYPGTGQGRARVR